MKRSLPLIDRLPPVGTLEHRIMRAAAPHLGIVTRPLLNCLGASDNDIARLVRRGVLVRQYPGVFSLGGHVLTREARWMAQTAAVGEGALLTGHPAASLLRVSRWSVDEPVVLVDRRHRGVEGVRVVEVGQLVPADRSLIVAPPITSSARTLVELAALGMTHHQLLWVVREAEFRGIHDHGALLACMHRARSRHGGGHQRLRRALELWLDAGAGTRSIFEDLALPVIECIFGREPIVNTLFETPMGAIEPDFRDPVLRLIVEIDGRSGHERIREQRLDRVNSEQLTQLGWPVLRVPGAVVRDTRRLERELVTFRDTRISRTCRTSHA